MSVARVFRARHRVMGANTTLQNNNSNSSEQICCNCFNKYLPAWICWIFWAWIIKSEWERSAIIDGLITCAWADGAQFELVSSAAWAPLPWPSPSTPFWLWPLLPFSDPQIILQAWSRKRLEHTSPASGNPTRRCWRVRYRSKSKLRIQL